MGIYISEKHGVNPSLGVCFWCGEEDGTVLLFGRMKNDQEAPRKAVATYEPCQQCKEHMALGVTLIEASSPPTSDFPEIQGGLYPTGRWWVIKREAAERIFNIPVGNKAFVDPEVVEKLGLAGEET